jgi:hypothetical protein
MDSTSQARLALEALPGALPLVKTHRFLLRIQRAQ